MGRGVAFVTEVRMRVGIDNIYMLLKSDVTRRDHVVHCHGFQECWFTVCQFRCQFHPRWHSLRITLKSTTLVHMRSRYAWTRKSWQRSEWRLDFNSVFCGLSLDYLLKAHVHNREWHVTGMNHLYNTTYTQRKEENEWTKWRKREENLEMQKERKTKKERKTDRKKGREKGRKRKKKKERKRKRKKRRKRKKERKDAKGKAKREYSYKYISSNLCVWLRNNSNG